MQTGKMLFLGAPATEERSAGVLCHKEQFYWVRFSSDASQSDCLLDAAVSILHFGH